MGSRNGPPTAPPTNREERLDSWKEIASHLGRTVRTVQRWEKKEGLPVHRHRHSKGETVYADTSEIESWLRDRDESTLAAPRDPPWYGGDKSKLVLAVGLLAILTLVLAWRFLDRSAESGLATSEPVLAFEERDWLLIADFENRSGEEVFDGTLEAALKRELAASRFVNVASPERVGDTLQLMGRPLDTPLSAAVAREVAQRDGGIRAVLTGRVEKLGPSYALSVDLVSPADGVTVASLSEEASDQKAILPALGRLSRRVRESLGEALPTIQQGEETLSQVSTPSFRALQLYSQANRLFVEHKLGGPDRNQAAEALLRDAIAEDPEFASAYTHLAWALAWQQRPPEESLPYAERAFELAEGATVAERYFIRGSYYSLRSSSSESKEEAEAALAQYQALLALDPGHFWAQSNMWLELYHLGRHREANELLFRAAELRPNNFATLAQAAWTAFRRGELEKARLYAERGAALEEVSDLADDQHLFLRGVLPFIPIYLLWVEGDLEAVLLELDRTVESLSGYRANLRQELTFWAAAAYVQLGMLRRASQIIRFVENAGWRAGLEYRAASARGDREGAREALERSATEMQRQGRDGDSTLAYTAERLAHLGFLAEAERNLSLLSEEPASLLSEEPGGLPHLIQRRPRVLTARGTLAFARGHYQEAIPQLEESAAFFRDWFNQSNFLFISETLARAWQAQGNLPQAILVLEDATRERGRMMPFIENWMRARLYLAELYHQAGREQEALEVETELRRYCVYADPDFVIRQELERRQQAAIEPLG